MRNGSKAITRIYVNKVKRNFTMCDNREEKRQHIDIIEAIITRMSENSKQMKKWCIALVSGVVGISFTANHPWLCIIAILVIVLFGYLDVFYLQLERCFRRLYNDVVEIGNDNQSPKDVSLYSTSIEDYKEKEPFIEVLKSPSIGTFYVCLLVGALILSVVSFCINGDDSQKIKLANEKDGKPLEVKLNEFDSLKISLDKIDSLIFKIDELKRMNVQIVDTVMTKSLIRKR